MGLSTLDVSRAIRGLEPIYGARKNRDELVGAWHDILRGFDGETVKRAARKYAQSNARFFPTPGQISEIARELQAETFGDKPIAEPAWDQRQEGPCPVCGAVLQLVTDPQAAREVWTVGKWRRRTQTDAPAPKRYQVIHDAERHRIAEVPIVGMSNRPQARPEHDEETGKWAKAMVDALRDTDG